MSYGKQLAENRAKHKEIVWANKLTGKAKEAHDFFFITLEDIKEDISQGFIVPPICIPSSLDYEKNINSSTDIRFYEVVNNFRDTLEKYGLRAIIEEMPENDINRYGDYDHYIHINPAL